MTDNVNMLFLERVVFFAETTPDAPAVSFVQPGWKRLDTLTYRQLIRQVDCFAQKLARSSQPGDRALILLPPGTDYLVGFLACLRVGVLAVPVNLPGETRISRVLSKVQLITKDCAPAVIITTAAVVRGSQAELQELVKTSQACVVELEPGRTSTRKFTGAFDACDADVAFLQYTSGSTGQPKGVINTHGAIMRNIEIQKSVILPNDGPICASWLPLYHDMGLIAGAMAPLAMGGHTILAVPASFAADPIGWLEIAASQKATFLPCPSFALDWCVAHYDADRCRDLDLSNVISVTPGAEPVNERQITTFFQTYARHGLTWDTLKPCYGLAEATLIASAASHAGGPIIEHADGAAVETGRILSVPLGTVGARSYVSNGCDHGTQTIKIVDPATLETLPENQIGEIWISGDALATGYWHQEQFTKDTFHAVPSDAGADEKGYLRTGDLGFLRQGHLFIAGRCKEVMIFHGQCHYPVDIEADLFKVHPDVIQGASAAFSVQDGDETERLVIVQELRRSGEADIDAIERDLQAHIARDHGITLYDLVLIRRGTLLRTTSGKIRRMDMKGEYLAGALLKVRPDTQNSVPEGAEVQNDTDLVRKLVLETMSEVLGGVKTHMIDPDQNLFSFGLDSLAVSQGIGTLEKLLDRKIPQQIIFDHPSVNALTNWLTTATPTVDSNVTPGDRSKNLEEGIAVVGLACRLPAGEHDIERPDEFWDWLLEGKNAIRPLSPERYRQDLDIPGFGACFQRVDLFDAPFFDIGAREAINLDPQQRLLLQTSWHALENAGIVPEQMRGSDTGVYIGVGTGDYAHLPFISGDLSLLDPYYGTGNAFAANSGRLSFFYDWHGPSMAVDTACSAAHSAVHLACQALRLGDCNMALAGGVKLQITPEIDLALHRASMLSPDGQCKTFDATADGYVRSEAVGLVVLKRLSDAIAAGDPIRAVIRSTVVAQDGASANLSAPNASAQSRLLQRGLNMAGWAPSDVDYIETHGTGTRLGDPIEMEGLTQVYGGQHPDRALILGAVKANLGHPEAAAGIVGLIKTVMALEEAVIPPHPQFNSLNPQIDLAAIPAEIPVSTMAWPLTDKSRKAGVTSFGFTGTISHILLEQAPQVQSDDHLTEGLVKPLLLSAKSEGSLKELRDAHLEFGNLHDVTPAEVANAVGRRRQHFNQFRTVAVGQTMSKMQTSLKSAALKAPPHDAPKVAFLFTGQGAQYAGMARDLYAHQPVFRDALDRADAAMFPYLNLSIRDMMLAETDDGQLNQTRFTQPALFACAYGISQLWRHFGVEPAAILGHSIGEVAGFVHAGSLSLESAARFIVKRGALMQERCEAGAMLATRIDETAATALIAGTEVSIAAINGPTDCVLAGSHAEIDRLADQLAGKDISAQKLTVSHAFHSALMDPILAELQAEAGKVEASRPAIPVVSSLTGTWVTEGPDPEYWSRHARESVRFADGFASLIDHGCNIFLEIGPKPILSALGRRIDVSNGREDATFLHSLRPGEAPGDSIANTVAALYMHRVPLNFERLFSGPETPAKDLPTYQFDQKSYWLEYVNDTDGPHQLPPVPGAHSNSTLALYEMAWQDLSEQPDPGPAPCLTLCGQSDAADGLAAQLWEMGVTVRLAVDPADAAKAPDQSILVWLGVPDAAQMPDDDGVWRFTEFCQTLDATGKTFKILLPLVGAQSEEVTGSAAAAGYWGAAQAIGIESRALKVLVLDFKDTAEFEACLVNEAHCFDALIADESLLKWNGQNWLTPRLQTTAAPTQLAEVDAQGLYLIAGGFGALGCRMIDWLVGEKGVRDIIVVSRSAPGARARSVIKQHKVNGAEITHQMIDITDLGALKDLFVQIDTSGKPLRGIIHAAGIGQFDSLAEITQSAFQESVRVKTVGSYNLHICSEDRKDVELFVLSTSIAGVWGSGLQIHYSASNAYQDGLIRHRNAQGLAGLSVAWGAWGGGAGLSDVSDDLLYYLEQSGVARFAPERGIATLDTLVPGGSGNVIAADVDWARFAKVYAISARTPLIEKLVPTLPEQTQENAVQVPNWVELDIPERKEIIETFVRREMSTILRADYDSLHSDTNFMSLGLDSILVMDFARICQQGLGLECPLSEIFNNPTVMGLTEVMMGLADVAETVPTLKTDAVALSHDPENLHEPFDLTPLQYAYWVGRDPRLSLGNVSCHAYLELDSQTLDLARFEAALNALVDRHDALRLIVQPDGKQRILPSVPDYKIAVSDFKTASTLGADSHLDATRTEMSHQVLPSETWPMFDVRLTALPGGKKRLHFSIDMLINDVTSSQIIWDELVAIYNAGSIAKAGLEPFTISFRDYVVARETPHPDQARRLERDKAYWLSRKDDLPPGPQLPLQCQPEKIDTPRFERFAAQIDAPRWARLQDLARAKGATPAAFLISAFSEVLAAWSDSLDFTLNLTIFDRLPLHLDVPRLIGDFTCVSLLDVSCAQSIAFDARLIEIQSRMMDVLEHRSFSAVDVLRELNRGRDRDQLINAPVVFTSQLGLHDPTKGATADSPFGEVVYGITQTPQVWLDHQVSEMNGALMFNWDVVVDLFPDGLIDAMFEAYCGLLTRLADSTQVWGDPVGDLRPGSQCAIRDDINQTQRDLPVARLEDLFLQSARLTPDAICVETETSALTYSDLGIWVRRISARLHNAGVGAGDRVAVLLEKGPAQVAATLAIMSQGAIYVPIAPDSPPARLAQITSNARIMVAIVQSPNSTVQDQSNLALVAADFDAGTDEQGPKPGRELDDLAYIIYTSGSTGTPKGVQVTHRSAANTVLDINTRFDVGPDDCVFGFSALSFDLSVYDIFGPLAVGAKLALPLAEKTLDTDHWRHCIDRFGVTVWNSVPAVLDLLLNITKGSDLSGLRVVMLSGDWIPLGLPARLANIAPYARLIAMGGATEAAIWSNWFEVKDVDPQWSSIPYGWPLSNQGYRVLDAQLRDRPDWVMGDLHITGTGLAQGYDAAPEQTAAAFYTHPDGQRLYKTGDMARYWPNGMIEFLGRQDNQVKIAGNRIELGEIESAILNLNEVRETVVDVITSPDGSRRLAAWVVLGSGAENLCETQTAPPQINAKKMHDALAGISRVPVQNVAQFWACQTDIACQTIRDHFQSTAVVFGENESVTAARLGAALGVKPEFEGLIARWLEILEKAGDLTRQKDGFSGALQHVHWDDLVARSAAVGIPEDPLRQFIATQAEQRQVLCGEADALEIFYKSGGALSPENLALLHPSAHVAISSIGAALGQLGTQLGRPARVLEIGARSGQATARLLEGLGDVSLVVSDPSSLLIREARQRLADAKDVQFTVFNPEEPVEGQGLEPHSFDAIIAFNALHRASDLGDLLTRLKTLLMPGGIIAASELTVNSALLDVSVALLENGYENLTDMRAGRGAPLLSAEDWVNALGAAELSDAQSFSANSDAGLSIIVGHGPDRIISFQPDRLTAVLDDLLPRYMVPRQLLAVGHFPLTPNGKVNRKALRAMLQDKRIRSKIDINDPPKTEVEQSLAGIWCRLLGVSTVNRNSDFFELGGDSLIAVRMAEMVREEMSASLALRDIFATPQLADLACNLGDVVETQLVPLIPDPVSRHVPFPMTDVQQAYFIGRQDLFPLGQVSTHLYSEIRVTDLSHDALEQAWHRLVDRHDMLRCVIDEQGMQRIMPIVPTYDILHTDLTGFEPSVVQAWFDAKRTEMSHAVFDTTQWPMFDIRAVQCDDGLYLLIGLDNLICDGRSMVMLLSEWAALARDEALTLQPLDAAFRDVVLHLQEHEASEAFTNSLEYWLDRIPDFPSAPSLPFAMDSSKIRPPKFRRLADRLENDEWSALQERCGAAGLSVNAVLMTAYGLALRDGGGGDEFLLNLTLFQRPAIHPDMDNIVGDFTSLILIPFVGMEGEKFRDVARRLQQQLWSDLDHASVSSVRLMREGLRRGIDTAGIAAPIVFTSGLGVGGKTSSGVEADWLGDLEFGISQTPQVWIDQQVVDRGGRLEFNWDYVEALFDAQWIEQVFHRYCHLLRALSEDENAWDTMLAPAIITSDPEHTSKVEASQKALVQRQKTTNIGVEELKKILTEGLSKEIGIKDLDPSRNFFELGASSLNLVRFHQYIQQSLQVDISVVHLFAKPTLDDLAYALSEAPQGGQPTISNETVQNRRKSQKHRRQQRVLQGNVS